MKFSDVVLKSGDMLHIESEVVGEDWRTKNIEVIRAMTDIERLIFLNTITQFWGLALGDDGWNPKKQEYYLLPEKVLDAYEKERYALLRKLALPETGAKP